MEGLPEGRTCLMTRVVEPLEAFPRFRMTLPQRDGPARVLLAPPPSSAQKSVCCHQYYFFKLFSGFEEANRALGPEHAVLAARPHVTCSGRHQPPPLVNPVM